MNIELSAGEYRTMHRQNYIHGVRSHNSAYQLNKKHPRDPEKIPQSVFEILLLSARPCYRRLLSNIFACIMTMPVRKFFKPVKALPCSCCLKKYSTQKSGLETKYSTRLCLMLYLSLTHSFSYYIFRTALVAVL